jgi:hypothetical protein
MSCRSPLTRTPLRSHDEATVVRLVSKIREINDSALA